MSYVGNVPIPEECYKIILERLEKLGEGQTDYEFKINHLYKDVSLTYLFLFQHAYLYKTIDTFKITNIIVISSIIIELTSLLLSIWLHPLHPKFMHYTAIGKKLSFVLVTIILLIVIRNRG